MKEFIVRDNGDEHEIDETAYDRLIEADLIYFCDECGVAHATYNWDECSRFLAS